MHISVIADMKKIFQELGHQVDDVSLSDHTWVFNRKKGSIPLLNNGNWMRISSEEMSEVFYETYKNHLDRYDGFIVTYPPAFAFLYKHFNKPIIVNIPIRYEWPFTFRAQEWSKLTNYLVEGYDRGEIFLIANNLADKLYAECFLNREVTYIPSLCDYFPETYTGSIDTALYYSKNKLIELDNMGLRHKQTYLKNHKYSDLLKHKSIVHIPYNYSYMSIFEQYSSDIPILTPDVNLLIDLYCKNLSMSEISFIKMYGAPARSSQPLSNSNLDPNNYTDLAIMRTLFGASDFYNKDWMPHIQNFSSFDELDILLKELDFKSISETMKKEKPNRVSKVHEAWSTLINKLS